jgi:hypothetical protein
LPTPTGNRRDVMFVCTLEIDFDQTAMGLPPVCIITHRQIILVKRGRLGGISEMPLLPFWG